MVEEKKEESKFFALRTTANREEQVMDFMTSHVEAKKYQVFSIFHPHGMRGYVFVEAESLAEAENAVMRVPYCRGVLNKEIPKNEIENMIEEVVAKVNIQKNDIVELISGPFKREHAKIIRIDKQKEEVVVELLEAAVSIPITVKMDSVKVIRRDTNDDEREEKTSKLEQGDPHLMG